MKQPFLDRSHGAIRPHAMPDGCVPVDTMILRDVLYVATSQGLYAYYAGAFHKLKFEEPVIIAQGEGKL